MFDKLNQMKQLASLMGQLGSPEKLREMRERAEAMQRELAERRITGEAGGGAARVTVSGQLKVTDVSLNPAVIATLASGGDQAEHNKVMIEKLIADATNDAMTKAQEVMREEMSKLTGGLDPGALGGPGGLGGLLGQN